MLQLCPMSKHWSDNLLLQPTNPHNLLRLLTLSKCAVFCLAVHFMLSFKIVVLAF